jgi:signal transduction histidine kinase/CheY-like chemotaxis protein
MAPLRQLRPRLLALLVFAGALAASGLFVGLSDRLGRVERRRAVEAVAHGLASNLEQELSSATAAPAALGALVARSGTPADFDGLARELLSLSGAIDSVQLAPGGVIRLIYPLPGNEAALGLDLLGDPVQRPDVQAAMLTRKVILAGPFRLRQGGIGLAARTAVFTHDARGEAFWGVASVIVRLPRLLEAARLDRLEASGYLHQLSRQDPVTGQRDVFAGSARPLEDPVVVSIAVPNGRWSLAVAPRAGSGPSPGTWIALAGAVLGALVVALLALRLFQEPERLREEVAARTAELEEAHREQRLTEASLRQAQKLEAIGLLAGGVAHDFNNLLVGIIGYSDLLAESAEPGSLAEEASQVIGQAARRAAELTRQLLAFARKGKQRDEPVDLHALVEEVSRLLSRTLGKDIQVARRPGATNPCVVGDPGQLQQVVLNLVVNARDAMPQGGTLTLETSNRVLDEVRAAALGLPPGEYTVLAVGDTGIGIAAAIRERIFEPFFTTKEGERGTGMGLAMVYGIVKNHGGAIRIDSVEGQGSRFEVWLPTGPAAPHLTAAPPPSSLSTSPRGQGRVLVVDDEEVVRRTAARLLRKLGYQPVEAAGGQEAIDWLQAHRGEVDVVLLDVGMPGMDGLSCFGRLREIEPGLRVVISSGFAEGGQVQAMLDLGAVDSVPKPYTPAELGQALARALAPAAGPVSSSRFGSA